MDDSMCVLCGAAITWDVDNGWVDGEGRNMNCTNGRNHNQHVPGA